MLQKHFVLGSSNMIKNGDLCYVIGREGSHRELAEGIQSGSGHSSPDKMTANDSASRPETHIVVRPVFGEPSPACNSDSRSVTIVGGRSVSLRYPDVVPMRFLC